MAYRFKLDETVQKGFQRIAREQLGRAIQELGAERGRASAIHETRKCLKRTRALLRLVRPSLGEEAFRGLNAELRDIAQLLSPARDKEILRETAAKLEIASGGADNPAFATLKALIEAQRQQGGRISGETAAKALEPLRAAKKRIASVVIEPADFRAIEKGLASSLKRARRCYAEAYASGASEDFHAWRKTVQQHWRHMQLVSRAWPALFGARVAMARRLSQMLGDDHDLAVLSAYVASLPDESLPAPGAHMLQKSIARRQKELRAGAAPLGRMLLAGGSKEFALRTSEIWAAAQDLDKTAEADASGTQISLAAAEPDAKAVLAATALSKAPAITRTATMPARTKRPATKSAPAPRKTAIPAATKPKKPQH